MMGPEDSPARGRAPGAHWPGIWPARSAGKQIGLARCFLSRAAGFCCQRSAPSDARVGPDRARMSPLVPSSHYRAVGNSSGPLKGLIGSQLF